ncbi:hypothetical protein ACFQL1_08910 [Halomicroarcula sp. GCM10025709]|uniref:hypothetical protein n=1 Tax=Halomicroarcula sp. GCM10025709 TaxID=3252669 RepID=UPI00360B7975
MAAASAVAGCNVVGSDGAPSAGGSTETENGQDTPASAATERFTVRLQGPETEQVLFTGAAIESVGPVELRRNAPGFTVTLADTARRDVAETFRSAGVTESPGEFELVHAEADRRYDIAPELATDIANGEWDGRLRLTYATETRAEQARQRLVGDA